MCPRPPSPLLVFSLCAMVFFIHPCSKVCHLIVLLFCTLNTLLLSSLHCVLYPHSSICTQHYLGEVGVSMLVSMFALFLLLFFLVPLHRPSPSHSFCCLFRVTPHIHNRSSERGFDSYLIKIPKWSLFVLSVFWVISPFLITSAPWSFTDYLWSHPSLVGLYDSCCFVIQSKASLVLTVLLTAMHS